MGAARVSRGKIARPVPAKVTAPEITGYFPRKRLFRLLDSARKRPVVWISAPPGSGKTTLVGSYIDVRRLPRLWYQVDERDADVATFFYYMGLAAQRAAPRKRKPMPLLTPEYLPGLPVFTRRFFDELFSRLPAPSVVVLDNYQKIPPGSMLHEVIRDAAAGLPPNVTLLLVSRSAPPPAFAPLSANRLSSVIGWEEMRLTGEETKGIARVRGGSGAGAASGRDADGPGKRIGGSVSAIPRFPGAGRREGARGGDRRGVRAGADPEEPSRTRPVRTRPREVAVAGEGVHPRPVQPDCRRKDPAARPEEPPEAASAAQGADRARGEGCPRGAGERNSLARRGRRPRAPVVGEDARAASGDARRRPGRASSRQPPHAEQPSLLGGRLGVRADARPRRRRAESRGARAGRRGGRPARGKGDRPVRRYVPVRRDVLLLHRHAPGAFAEQVPARRGARGPSLRAGGEWEKAIACYQKGLEVDHVSEEMCRGLISCNLRMGSVAEAHAVYQRCCRTLSSALGVSPSPDLQAMLTSAPAAPGPGRK